MVDKKIGNGMRYVSIDFLKNRVSRVLCQVGVLPEQATIVAESLVYADACGIASHGTIRLEHYIERIKQGGINLSSTFSTQDGKYAWNKCIDAEGGLGHVATKKAVELGLNLVKTHGIATVAITNTSHCGALSYYMKDIAYQDFIGLGVLNTDVCVVPHGGKEPFLGTNPIAWAFPQNDAENPIIADMSTSESSFGKILAAQQNKEKISKTWGVDAQGNATDDPHKIYALLPMAAHKGYAMAYVVEILSALMTGSPFGVHLTPMYRELGKLRNLSVFFLLIDPELYISKDEFKQGVSSMIEELHQQPCADNVEKIFFPGEVEFLNRKKAEKHGVPILESVYQYLHCDKE